VAALRKAGMAAVARGAADPDIQVANSTPPAAVIIVDPQLCIVHAEGAAFDQRGFVIEDWPGRGLCDVLPADALAELEPRYRAALAGTQQSFEYSSVKTDSTFLVQITPVRGEDGAITSVVAVMQDISESRRVIEELSRSEGRLRESERLVGVGSWELIPETGAISYSRGFARLLSLEVGEVLTLSGFMALVQEDDREVVAEAIAQGLRSGSAACEFRILGAGGAVRTVAVQGEAVWAAEGRQTYLRGATLDVTEAREAEREAREAERERLAAVSLFRHGFDAAPIGMVLGDPIDFRFVRVNDAMCQLLGRPREQLIGETIASVTHPDDREPDLDARRAMLDGTVASFEGEKRYLRPDGSTVWTTLHVAPVRNADGSVQEIFAQVIDINDRKEREARFEQDVNDAVWLGQIRDAIDDDRLVLYGQPIVDLQTGETIQRELLLRMRAEDGSIIAPGDFLPIAERYGLISEIDRWVLRQAVDLAALGEPTEFNLSAASIGDPDILRELASALEETGADPALLVVEVTETAMMNQLDAGRRFAEQVALLGCRLALDDFGTGFASLSYLKQIPAQVVKIDIEFVRDLVRSETDERLVRGIIGIAREFEQTTIAEGIEDEATLVLLRELGVHCGQGYLLGRPAPICGAEPICAPAGAQPESGTEGSDQNPPAAPRPAAPKTKARAGRRKSDEAVWALAQKFGRALRAGSSSEAEQVMDEALSAGVSPAAIHALVIEPAMVRVGELWECNAISVADEHLATAVSHGVLLRLFDALSVARARSRELVLLAAVEGQHHILGLRMVADVLEGAGFDVLFLGSDVPLDALRDFVAEHKPAVIGLGFGIPSDVSHLAEAIRAIHEVSPEPRIMLGGRGVPAGLRDAGYPFVPSSLEVLETVQHLLDGPPQRLSEVVSTLIPKIARSARPAHDLGDSSPVHQRLVDAVAESSDLAREYMKESRVFRDLALRDPVTGLANRRAFDDQIYLHTHTHREPGALLLVDVDDFKRVNDTSGHEAGDSTLRLVGEAIADSLRPQDFPARIGGDEFAAILPVADLSSAREIGERIRLRIAGKTDLPVTVSIGVAPLAGDARTALLAADVALFEAKSGGRNQVSGVSTDKAPGISTDHQ
jgi:diguanylate cyclase (GGDEF)-like protein/PAS domain S-box-containing protein